MREQRSIMAPLKSERLFPFTTCFDGEYRVMYNGLPTTDTSPGLASGVFKNPVNGTFGDCLLNIFGDTLAFTLGEKFDDFNL